MPSCATTTEAAPLATGFGEWEPRASLRGSIVKDSSQRSVTNTGQKPTNALLTLHYDNGAKNYEIQQTIQPSEQMWLNLADLIHHSAPDRKGNALPADLTSGTYDLEDLNPGPVVLDEKRDLIR